MVEFHLAAIDVLPSRIQNAAIRQNGRCVVVFRAVRQSQQIGAIRIASVEHTDLGLPATDPALTARGNEYDSPVGQIRRFVIVKLARRDLPQTVAVQIQFVQMIEIAAGLAVREEHFLRVIVKFGITDRSSLGIQQHGHFASLQIQFAQLAHVRLTVACVRFLLLVVAVVSNVRVPMRIVIPQAHGEDDLLDLV